MNVGCRFFLLVSLLISGSAVFAQKGDVNSLEVNSPIVFSGYFSREENDGKMARLSGKSHYMKFYAPDRIIRLFVPYPYSMTIKPGIISKVFDSVSKMAVGDAYLRGGFGYLEQDVIANVGKVKNKSGTILFDCNVTVPCRVEFAENALKVIKKGILMDHIILFEHVDE